MAIYFGNLDRELADRQNVLKEDAARQYRGSRDMMESFSDLGKTVERGMKDYSTAKLESAKLKYNTERNKESDQIRKLTFQQNTQRNRENTLDSQLKNVERFRATSVANHIGRQWYWRDPKAVRTAYDDRMKTFTADQINIDPEQRIKAYPHLFGKKGLEQLTYYEDLLKLKEKDGNSAQITDEDIKAARNNLPVAPMGFMAWAKDGGFYNDKITGNPGRVAGAMQTTLLQNAGYDIPNVTELNNQNSTLQAGITEEKIPSKKSLAEKELDLMGRNIIYKKKGAKVEVEETNETKNKMNPLLKPGEKPYKIINGQVWDNTFGLFRDSIEDVMLAQPYTSEASSKVELFGDEGRDHPGLSDNRAEYNAADQILSVEADNAVQNVMKVNKEKTKAANVASALRRYDGRQRYNQPDEVQVAVENGNPFTAVDKTLRSLGLYGKTDQAAKDMIQEGRILDPPPELASMGGDLNNFSSVLDYKNLPAYKETNSWANLSKEEKTELLQHPAIVAQGANPEKVFNFEKAREKLEDIDHEIVMLHNPLKKYSPLKDPGSSFSKLAVPVSKYGGKVGVNVELASLVEKYNATMPLLVEERKKLLTNFNKAERSMDASKTQGGINESPMYLGAETTDNQLRSTYGSASDYGISPVTIRPKAEPIDVSTSIDLGYQAAVDANYAENTQKEIIDSIIEREGRGVRGYGDAYFDGKDPITTGNYAEGRGETLTLAGGNNIYDTINSMPAKERKIEMEEVATAMFGNGGTDRKEFLRFINMNEKDHKKNYKTRKQREALRLSEPQQGYLTNYMMKNHLNRLVKNHPYLSDIAQYPKEMQVFLMDNTFNMGPGWLKKFKKTEVHLKNWVKTRKSSDLEKMKEEYKNSDHYRNTTRAQDLLAMI